MLDRIQETRWFVIPGSLLYKRFIKSVFNCILDLNGVTAHILDLNGIIAHVFHPYEVTVHILHLNDVTMYILELNDITVHILNLNVIAHILDVSESDHCIYIEPQ